MKSFLQDFACGTISGIGNCLSGYILDTLKVRMQIDPTLTMTEALKHAIKTNHGLINLFSGMYYPLITVPLVNAVVFTSYEFYKKIRDKQQLSFIDGIQNGIFAGLANTVIVSPVQLIKCKMQTDKKSKYLDSHECLKQVLKQQGIEGLFKGSVATAFRQIFAYGAQFATYEYLKEKFTDKQTKPHMEIKQSLVVGCAAGLSCWIFSYPQDVIKTKLQLSSYQSNYGDGGIYSCGREIYKLSGMRGYFVGLTPCLYRAAIANSIGIVIYQQSQQYFHKGSSKQ